MKHFSGLLAQPTSASSQVTTLDLATEEQASETVPVSQTPTRVRVTVISKTGNEIPPSVMPTVYHPSWFLLPLPLVTLCLQHVTSNVAVCLLFLL